MATRGGQRRWSIIIAGAYSDDYGHSGEWRMLMRPVFMPDVCAVFIATLEHTWMIAPARRASWLLRELRSRNL